MVYAAGYLWYDGVSDGAQPLVGYQVIVAREARQQECQFAVPKPGVGDESAFGEEENDELTVRVCERPREKVQERIEVSLRRLRADLVDGLIGVSSQTIDRLPVVAEFRSDEFQEE